MTDLQKRLFELQDVKYKEFHCKLVPTVDPEKIIGIRSPIMAKFVKQFAKEPQAKEFIKVLPHEYYDENSVHAYLVSIIKDIDTAIAETERFLPYVDNWATCDSFAPKIFKKYPGKVYEKIEKWVNSDKTYTIRFGVGLLMSNYLDDYFSPEHPKLVASIHSDEYYVNMMLAWYFATALAKQHDTILPYFEEFRLDTWVHNKAIQKCIESYRIDDDTKQYLRTLKIKTNRQ